MHRELAQVPKTPDGQAHLMDEGGEISGGTAQQSAKVIRDDLAKWTKLVKAAGIKAE